MGLFGRSGGTGVYLVDYHVFEIPDRLQMPRHKTILIGRDPERDKEQVDLLGKYTYGPHNGVGDIAGLGPGLHEDPPNTSLEAALEETSLVMFECVEKLLNKLNLRGPDIGCVVCANSNFVPVPSLSAVVANHFRMGTTTLNYCLSGSGCVTGMSAVQYAVDVLKANKEMRALVMMGETTTAGFFSGKSLELLAPNTIFRLGGAALLLSNRRSDAKRAKYCIEHIVHSLVLDDEAHLAIKLASDPDDFSKRGFKINAEAVSRAAAAALQENMEKVAPLLLSRSQLAKQAKAQRRVPDLRQGADHVAVQPASVATIKGATTALGFDVKTHAVPSLQTLERFGNVCSPGVMYVLANLETRVGIQRGQCVLAISLGSGFKCCSLILKARKDIKDAHAAWKGYPRIYLAPSSDPGFQKYGKVVARQQSSPTFEEIVAAEKIKVAKSMTSEE
eukprot:jgi/Botrbrau1/1692/Bobra.116_2s0034.1